ncbi:MAG: hypothetical protein Alpg2KO_01450 [Alphaproteobacteria bacterium]
MAKMAKSQPRLIVLDDSSASYNLEHFAQRLSHGLRGDRAPLVLMAHYPARTDTEKRFHTIHQPDRTCWREMSKQAAAALADGRDVVLAGPVRSGQAAPGEAWIARLAETAGARLVAHRMLFNHPDKPRPDPEPDHDWPVLDWVPLDETGDYARAAATRIEKATPGQTASADGHVYLLDCPLPKRRQKLASALAAQEGGGVLDVDALKHQISTTGDLGKQPDHLPAKQREVKEALWKRLEADASAILRKGKRLIVLPPTGKDEDLTAFLAQLYPQYQRIGGGEMICAQVTDGMTEQEPQDNALTLVWPKQADQDQAAEELAREIGSAAPEPSLQDMLDMPLAERRRPLLP